MGTVNELKIKDPVRPDPYQLIANAIDKGIDISAMQQLFDMQRQFEADKAKREYAEAMRGLQGKLTTVIAKESNEQTRSRYANLAGVEALLRPLKHEFGFSSVFNTREDAPDGWVIGVCDVHHIGGHSTQHTLKLPLDDSGIKDNKNKTQVHAIGSSVSYIRRYLEMMIYNVVVSDEDDDGQAAGKNEIASMAEHIQRLLNQMDVLRDSDNLRALADIKDGLHSSALMDDAETTVEDAARAAARFSGKQVVALGMATKNGGIFTTEERAMQKGIDGNDQSKAFKDFLHVFRTDSEWFNREENQL